MSPIERKPQALETARICPIYAQKKILRNCDNHVISRDFYRFSEYGDEVCGSHAERLIGSYTCHAFFT